MTPPTDPPKRARARRNLVMALCLAAFVALIFLVTVVRLHENLAALS